MRVFVVLILLTGQATAEEQIMIGRVHELHLYSNEHARCASKCVPLSEIEEGTTDICISNSCGCGVAILAVDEVLKGGASGNSVSLNFSIGEWCKPQFSIDGEPVIVQVIDGRTYSGGIENYPGPTAKFETQSFRFLGGVDLSKIANEDALISLKEWRLRTDF